MTLTSDAMTDIIAFRTALNKFAQFAQTDQGAVLICHPGILYREAEISVLPGQG